MKNNALIINANKAVPSFADEKPMTCEIKASETVVLLSTQPSLLQDYMLLLSGQTLPKSGDLTILDKESEQYSDDERLQLHKKIAYVLPNNSLLSSINGYNNLILASRYHQYGSEKERTAKAKKLLLNMPDKAQLSALPADMGLLQNKYLSIARPLMLDPLVLFLDNPFIGLNYYDKALMMNHIGSLVTDNDLSLVMSTDELIFARKYADKIIYCDKKDTLVFDSWNSFYNCDRESISLLFKIQRIKRDG